MSGADNNGYPGQSETPQRVNAQITPVIVPELDAERTAGTLVTWHCGEGETISAGTALLDIEADTISTLPAPASGTLRRRLATAGDMLQEGALIAVLADDAVDDAAIDEFVIGFAAPGISPGTLSPGEPAEAEQESHAQETAAEVAVELPEQKRGEPTAAQDAELDEAQHSQRPGALDEAPEETLDTPPAQEDDTAGEVTAAELPDEQVSQAEEEPSPSESPPARADALPQAEPVGEAAQAPEPEQAQEAETGELEDDRPTVIRKAGTPAPPLEERDPLVASEASMPVSPLARRLADKLGVDIESIKGTGRNGRVTRRDVELAAGIAPTDEESAEPDAVAEEVVSEQAIDVYQNPYESEDVSDAVRTRAQEQTIPHTVLNAEAHVGDLSNARVKLIMEAGGDVPLEALLVRAAALALRRVPRVNANLVDDEIRVFTHADVSVAVPTGSGMQAPVIRAAEAKTVKEIAKELEDFVHKAQQNELTDDDISGGTFSLVSLASSGVTQFEPAINPPQVATLALGAPVEQVVVREGNPKITTVMRLALCCDLRAVDLGIGAQFVQTVTEILEDPEQLLEE